MRAFKVLPTITSYEHKSFAIYLEEVSKIKLLTLEEEVALGPKLLAGDADAIKTIVKANLRFVISVANQHVNRSNKMEDLVDEGNIGLQLAAERFDYRRGFKFISYAVWYIRKQMFEYDANCARTIRLPINKINAINKLKKEKVRFLQDTGREPSNDELFDACSDIGISKHIVDELFAIEDNNIASFDKPIGEGQSDTMLNFLPNHDEFAADFNLSNDDLKITLKRILCKLPVKEQDVLKMIYGIETHHPLTVKEIAEKLGMSSEAIRQIKIRALNKLTVAMKKRNITTY